MFLVILNTDIVLSLCIGYLIVYKACCTNKYRICGKVCVNLDNRLYVSVKMRMIN